MRCLLLAFVAFLPVVVEAASPRLTAIMPRGVQRGTEVRTVFYGRNLTDTQEILFYGKGVTATKIEPDAKNSRRVFVTLKVDADCRLGEHVAQIRAKSGISDYRTFWVGPYKSLAEKEPNTDFATPQKIPLNITVAGVIQNEDVDHFAVECKKGQRLSVEVEALRLGTVLFDPYIAILNSKRFELAAADDTPLTFQDGTCSIVCPEDGTYIVQIRETSFGGSSSYRYRLHVGTFPRPLAVYPAGGKRGTKTNVTFIGDPTGAIKKTIDVPSDSDREQIGLNPADSLGTAPTANPFRISDFDNVLEAEPNNDFKSATKITSPLPVAFNGIIEKDGDIDIFRFTAKKGQTFQVECFSRRIRSPLDAVMTVYRARDNRSLASADDSRGPDPAFRFQAPEDGDYYLRVTDHLGKGGANYTFRVEFLPYTPGLSLSIPRYTRYGQERQQIVIPRGGKFATVVNASRRNFGGELVFDIPELPAGVKMTAIPMASNMSSTVVLFEAAKDAPIEGGLVDFIGKLNDPKRKISGGFNNTADLVRYRNATFIWKKTVDKLPIAVTQEAPYSLEIIQPKVPLVQNGTMRLKIKATRRADFKGAINVMFPFRPPGVGATYRVTIPAGKDTIDYPLTGYGSARIGKWKVYAIGSAQHNGEVLVSSQLAELEIAAAFVTARVDRGAVEQGQDTSLLVKFNQKIAFEGKAKLKLLGLPAKATAPDLEFTKDTKELTIPIKTDKTTPPGRHKTLLAQVIITKNGEPIVSRAGRSELRVDKPLPKPKTTPKPKPKPKAVAKTPVKKPEPPKKKPLSRLERLRLEAKKRTEEANK